MYPQRRPACPAHKADLCHTPEATVTFLLCRLRQQPCPDRGAAFQVLQVCGAATMHSARAGLAISSTSGPPSYHPITPDRPASSQAAASPAMGATSRRNSFCCNILFSSRSCSYSSTTSSKRSSIRHSGNANRGCSSRRSRSSRRFSCLNSSSICSSRLTSYSNHPTRGSSPGSGSISKSSCL
jgi:hypothetical protein